MDQDSGADLDPDNLLAQGAVDDVVAAVLRCTVNRAVDQESGADLDPDNLLAQGAVDPLTACQSKQFGEQAC